MPLHPHPSSTPSRPAARGRSQRQRRFHSLAAALRGAAIAPSVLESLEKRVLLSTSVTTYHNDAASTGQNLTETVLTPLNVTSGAFGKLFSAAVDGQVYAQPLYVSGVNITTGTHQGVHNVVFVATENDSLYAIDANNGTQLWKDSFLIPEAALQVGTNTVSVSVVTSTDVNTGDINPIIGITGTPVIDQSTGYLFLDAKTKQIVNSVSTAPHFVQTLFKVALANGTTTNTVIGDTTNASGTFTYNSGPYTGDATHSATGAGSIVNPSNTNQRQVYFNALRENDRGALSLYNGNIYIPFASHGDNTPYHGWILGYNENTLTNTAALNVNPNGSDDGIWQGGGRIAMDGQGNMYVETGNGTFDTTQTTNRVHVGGAYGFPVSGDYGDSFVKIALDNTTSPNSQNINGWGLKVVDYFTPLNQASLSSADQDLGSGGPIVLPDNVGGTTHAHLLLGSGKDAILYLIDRDNMGGFSASTDNIVQEIAPAAGGLGGGGSYGTAGFFNDGTTSRIYYGAKTDNLRAYTISASGTPINTTPAKSPDTFGSQGDTPSISASGISNGIVWAIDGGTSQLRAYKATPTGTTLSELYTSAQNAARDALGTAIKFTAPTVADGEVFVGTSNSLVAYGELTAPTQPPTTPGNLQATDVNNTQINLSWTASTNTPFGYYVELSGDGGNTWTQIATVGATADSVTGLQPGTPYKFRVRAYNSLGTSAYSNIASATTSNPNAVPNFPSGFSSGNNIITINGNTKYNGSNLELTDGNTNEDSSAFTNNAVSVQGFNTTFTFQITSPTADGFTYTMQGIGPTALGAGGGSLGYAGINNSVAVKFDIYPNENQTGLYTNGASPDDTIPPAIDMGASGINLHSGDIMQVNLSYDGVNLQETVTDTSTNAVFQHTYPINIPATIGAGYAYVGFTGATGGAASVQQILTWTYSPVLVPPYAPSNLAVAPASGTELDLSWSESLSSVTNYNILKQINGTYTQIAQVPGTAVGYNDTGLTMGTTYSYEVVASNAAGSSAPAGPVSATTPTPPAAPSNLQASNITTSGDTLTWQNNANNATGVQIMRQLESDSTQWVTTLPASATTFTDSNLLPGRAYDYIVSATNLAGPSSGVHANIQTVPLAPTGVMASAGGGQVFLNWIAEGHAVTQYNVYRGTSAGGESATAIATNVTGSSFDDTGLTPGTTYYYKITAVDTGGEGVKSGEVSATPVTPSSVAGRLIFYNDSYWNNPANGFTDDNAVDTSKSALLPGGTASFANYTGSSMGINGVMIDISGLPAGSLTPSDFTFKFGNDNNPAGWTLEQAVPAVSIRRGMGTGGSDRVELIWADNAIQDTWLQVAVLADAATGLASPDVFYFGNSIGETGDSTIDTFVNAGDFIGVRDHPANFTNRALPGNPYDFNHDSFVDGTDLIITRDNTNNFTNALKFITPPAGAAAPVASPATIATTLAAPQPQATHPFSVSPLPTAAASDLHSRHRKRPWWA